MGMNSLSTGEMVSLTRSLVETGHADRDALERIPTVAVLLPYVDASYEALLRTQRNPEQVRLAGISAMQAKNDWLHDRLARGVWHGMECHKFLVQDTKLAEKIGEAQGDLFPDALKVVQYSYRETAGQGALLASRLGPEQEALLASLPVQGGNMLDMVREWIAVAERLGALENERTRLTSPLPPGSAARARNQWIRTIRAMRTVIELEGTQDPEVLRVLQRIDDAVSAAERRSRGGQGDDGDVDAAPVDGDVPGDDAAGDDVVVDGVDVAPEDGEGPVEDGVAAGGELPVSSAVIAGGEDDALSADTLA